MSATTILRGSGREIADAITGARKSYRVRVKRTNHEFLVECYSYRHAHKVARQHQACGHKAQVEVVVSV